MSPKDLIYNLVTKIPKGRVTTYGDIAKYLGLKTPRIVGWVLHQNTDGDKVPCHRVVFADGRVSTGYAFGGEEVQRAKLEAEGVDFQDGKVNKSQIMHFNDFK
jgi:methylated-DNA-protein-cysteine methyltransferase-like protein